MVNAQLCFSGFLMVITGLIIVHLWSQREERLIQPSLMEQLFIFLWGVGVLSIGVTMMLVGGIT